MNIHSQPFGEGLPVSLISTEREDLKVCRPSDVVGAVRNDNPDDFDHIPVVDDLSNIIGSFNTKEPNDEAAIVANCMQPLISQAIIGESSSIISFIENVSEQPFSYTVGKNGISGLVTWSDIQKLPARTALFALVTQLELGMMHRITQLYDQDEWMGHLSPSRQKKVIAKISDAREGDSLIAKIHYTDFCDKRDLLKKTHGGRAFERCLKKIEKLRNSLAHASHYAQTRTEALAVSSLVTDLGKMIRLMAEEVEPPEAPRRA